MIKKIKTLYDIEQTIDVDKWFEMMIATKPRKEIEKQLNYTGVVDGSLIEIDYDFDIWDVIESYQDSIYQEVMEDTDYINGIYQRVEEGFIDNLYDNIRTVNNNKYIKEFVDIFKFYTYNTPSVERFGDLIENIYADIFENILDYIDTNPMTYKYNILYKALKALKENGTNFSNISFTKLFSQIALEVDNVLNSDKAFERDMKPSEVVDLLNEFYIKYIIKNGSFNLDYTSALEILLQFAHDLVEVGETFIYNIDLSETQEFNDELEDSDNIVYYLSNVVYDLWDYLDEYVEDYRSNIEPDLPQLVDDLYEETEIDLYPIYDVFVYEDKKYDTIVFDLFRTFAPACRLKIEYSKKNGIISIYAKNTHATGADNDLVNHMKHIIDIYPNNRYSSLNMFCTGSFGYNALNTQDLTELIMYSFIGDTDYSPYALYSTDFHYDAQAIIKDILNDSRYTVYYDFRYDREDAIVVANRISDALKTFYEMIKEYRKERMMSNDKTDTTKKVL